MSEHIQVDVCHVPQKDFLQPCPGCGSNHWEVYIETVIIVDVWNGQATEPGVNVMDSCDVNCRGCGLLASEWSVEHEANAEMSGREFISTMVKQFQLDCSMQRG